MDQRQESCKQEPFAAAEERSCPLAEAPALGRELAQPRRHHPNRCSPRGLFCFCVLAASDALTLLRVAPRANARMLFGGGGEGGEGGGMNMMETSTR